MHDATRPPAGAFVAAFFPGACASSANTFRLGRTLVREEPTATALTHYTPEEYLALERHAEFKSEYLDGRIVAMTGASIQHVTITGNVHGELRTRLRGTACRPFMGDMRVRVEGGRRYT